MNASQNAMYWAEFAKLRDVLRAKGKTFAEIEEHRHALTRRALGANKSSKHFTNADLDKVLARIKAEREPGNLDAQIALQESPEVRRKQMLQQCYSACSRMWSHGNDTRLVSTDAQTGYIRGVARNVIKKSLDACTAEDLAKVLGCLLARVDRLVKQQGERVAALTENPRGAEAGTIVPDHGDDPF